MNEFRIETDTLGKVNVPQNAYWQAQTQRSLQSFAIGIEKMPLEIIQSFAYLKKACALTNHKLNRLDSDKTDAICLSCDDILNDNLY